jgi:putative phosphoesterase
MTGRRRTPARTVVGLVSDTHGLLRPEVLEALAGSDHIVHAGDIGDASILARLGEIAPVTAVRGNNDVGPWAASIPETAVVRAGGASLFVLHDVKTLAVDPVRAGVAAVIAGHSHRPSDALRDGVRYLNPGSAGPRRFSLPITVARLVIDADGLAFELVDLAPAAVR